MILLPIGHDDSEVRRQPWVTYGLMAACLIALLATSGRVAESERRMQAAQAHVIAALDLWSKHPYLYLPQDAIEALPKEAAAPYEELARSPEPPPSRLSKFAIANEQAELDAQVAAALADMKQAEASHPYRQDGFVPGAITAWGLFAHMFMHAGWLHLLGNLFMLFMAGPALEDRWGRPLFGALYLLAGIGGALTFALFSKDPMLPLVGASGAIAGVFGAFLVRFWSTKIRFWYMLWYGFRIRTGTFSQPAYVMLPLWLANEVLQAWVSHAFGFSTGVANTAHVGGFFVGAAAALAVKGVKLDAAIERSIEQKTGTQGNLAVADALALREQGDLRGAIAQLALQVKKVPRDAEAIDAYWDACVAAGCAGDAAPAVMALAQRELHANDGARAAQRYVEVRAALPAYGFDSAFVARLVPSLRAMDRDLALQALRWLAAPQSAPLAATLAQRALDQARELDPLVAKRLARKLVASGDLPPETRERFLALAKTLDAEAPDPPAAAAGGIELASESDDAAPAPFTPREARHEPPVTAPVETPDWDHTAQDFAGDEPSASLAAPLGGPELTDPEDAPVSDESALAAAALIAKPDEEWDALALLDEEEPAAPLPPSPRFASLKITEAVPLGVGEGALRIALDGGRKAQLGLTKVDAVALAAVRGLGPKPVLVIDLLVGWRSLEGGELRCVRMRSDRFDPRKLAPAPDPLASLRAFVAQLIAATGATPLQAADPKRKDALTPFADATTYEREVLEVGS